MGGLRFRDLHLFNIALLRRQVWRLLHQRGTLYFWVLSVKYFSDGNIFNPKSVDKPSYSWLSILAGVKELEVGFGWQIANGGFEGLNESFLLSQRPADRLTFVRDFWVRDIYA